MAVTDTSPSGKTVTVTAPNHGFNTGDVVAVSGVLPELFDGVFTVTRIDSNQFRFSLPGNYARTNSGPPPYINQRVNGAVVNTTVTKVLGQWETSYRYDNQGRVILKLDRRAVRTSNE